jgi:hypothetical protein
MCDRLFFYSDNFIKPLLSHTAEISARREEPLAATFIHYTLFMGIVWEVKVTQEFFLPLMPSMS